MRGKAIAARVPSVRLQLPPVSPTSGSARKILSIIEAFAAGSHSLQYILAGVNSDGQVREHNARGVMAHAEWCGCRSWELVYH
jgi:hypothetical protein